MFVTSLAVGIVVARKPDQPPVWVNGKSNSSYAKFRRARRQRWINLYKTRKGCEFCGYNKHGVALDFDHIDPETKKFSPSSQSITFKLKVLIEEIRKCRILCANCHRIHSYENEHFPKHYKKKLN